MSRIDPGLLQPNIPRMDPWPTYAQRQQEELQRANIESQIAERKANETIRSIAAQEKLAQAQKMQQDWEEKRRTYNAQEAVRSYIQDAQSQGRPMPSINELIGVGGNYAMPFIKEMVDRTKDDLANRAEQTKKYLALHDAMIDAFSMEPDVSKHPDIEKTVYQRAMQAGWVTPEEVNQFLQKPPDQLTELEAQRKTLLRNNEDLKAKTAQNLEDQKVLETAAKAGETQAKTAREQEELRRIQKNLPPVPPAPAQPSAGYTPEAFKQQVELAKIRAQIAAENKVDPSQVLTGQDESGETKFFVYDKKTKTTEPIEGLTPKAKEPPAAIQTNVNVAGKALDQIGIIRNIFKAHPEMVGPIMGRMNEFMQGIGSNPFAGNKQLEELGATLTGHLRYLFAQELKNAIGSKPGEFLAKELKEASPSRKQDPAIFEGFLKSVENNARVTLRAAKKQYKYDPFKVEDESGGGTAPAGGWKIINVK